MDISWRTLDKHGSARVGEAENLDEVFRRVSRIIPSPHKLGILIHHPDGKLTIKEYRKIDSTWSEVFSDTIMPGWYSRLIFRIFLAGLVALFLVLASQ